MQIESYKIVFAAVFLLGILLFASPTIALLVKAPPSNDPFSKIYLLGSDKTLDTIPYSIQTGVDYTIYLGVGNNMGQSSYYSCDVKFRNNVDDLPNKTAGTPSSLPTLYEYRPSVNDGQNWSEPLTFRINEISISEDKCVVSSITINGITYLVNKEVLWDSIRKGYFYGLFVELWIYRPDSASFQYYNRAVSITLKIS
jgi:hypothetical protein